MKARTNGKIDKKLLVSYSGVGTLSGAHKHFSVLFFL